MAYLDIRVGATTKKHELKDDSTKPRLSIRTSQGTKYLSLMQGTTPGSLTLRGASGNYSIKDWGLDAPDFWKGISPDEPLRGMGGTRGDRTHGGAGIWVLVNEYGYPVVAFGRLGADRPDENNKALWFPSVEGTDSETRWPTNMRLTAEQVTHPKRLKPNIRLATIISSAGPTESTAVANPNGDRYSSKNYVILNDVINCLTTKKGNYYGITTRSENEGAELIHTYWYGIYGYGYDNIDTPGVYFPREDEEFGNVGGRPVLPDGGGGIDADGFKVSSPNMMRVIKHAVATIFDGPNTPPYTTGMEYNYTRSAVYKISTGIHSQYGSPYVQMYGVYDTNYDSDGDWAQRDFYMEFPYAWGEDTNPNDYFTFSPKQILNAVKAIATSKGILNTNYGFTRGRNY